MTDSELVARYNYDEFVPEKFERWLNFEASPAIGEPAPVFPLWDLAGQPTDLAAIWNQSRFTIIEFGSFT